MAASVPSSIGSDSDDDLKEPRAWTVAAIFELIEAPVGNDEDFLCAIFDVRGCDAESPEVPPDEVNVLVVHGAEARDAIDLRDSGRDGGLEREENSPRAHILHMAAFCRIRQLGARFVR
jgi:hypothetical protein